MHARAREEERVAVRRTSETWRAVRRSLVEVLAQLAQQDEQFVWKRAGSGARGAEVDHEDERQAKDGNAYRAARTVARLPEVAGDAASGSVRHGTARSRDFRPGGGGARGPGEPQGGGVSREEERCEGWRGVRGEGQRQTDDREDHRREQARRLGCKNVKSGKEVRIKSAQRLRGPAAAPKQPAKGAEAAPKAGKPCGTRHERRDGAPQPCQGAPGANEEGRRRPRIRRSAPDAPWANRARPGKEKRLGRWWTAAIMILKDGKAPMGCQDIVNAVLEKKPLDEQRARRRVHTLYAAMTREITEEGQRVPVHEGAEPKGAFALVELIRSFLSLPGGLGIDAWASSTFGVSFFQSQPSPWTNSAQRCRMTSRTACRTPSGMHGAGLLAADQRGTRPAEEVQDVFAGSATNTESRCTASSTGF